MALPWPNILFPGALMWMLENTSRGGGISTNGMEQFVGSGSSRWRADYESVPIQTEDEVLAWRAFLAAMRGRAGTVLLPVIDWRRSPWPRDAYGRLMSPRSVRHDRLDNTQFADPAIPSHRLTPPPIHCMPGRPSRRLFLWSLIYGHHRA